MNRQPRKPILIGQRFGKLVVVGQEGMKGPHITWNCLCDCGLHRIVTTGNLNAGQVKSCGCNKRRKGRDNPNWKGGKVTNPDGYVYVTVYPNDGTRKRVPEPVLMMEQHLGRKLYPDETVHHKNGIRNDNRLENFELKASSHGRGQSIPDLVAWAKEILRRYD
jgi:hypothetical protein